MKKLLVIMTFGLISCNSGYTENVDRASLGQQLIKKAEEGDVIAVQRLIKKSADINASDEETMKTPLIVASSRGNLETVKVLLEKEGINKNATDYFGKTALTWAILREHPAVIDALIKAVVNVNAADREGKTALIHAAIGGYEKGVIALIVKGAQPNQADNQVWTPLMWATNFGHLKIVELLLNAGANPSIINDQNKRAIDLPTTDKIRAILQRAMNRRQQR